MSTIAISSMLLEVNQRDYKPSGGVLIPIAHMDGRLTSRGVPRTVPRTPAIFRSANVTAISHTCTALCVCHALCLRNPYAPSSTELLSYIHFHGSLFTAMAGTVIAMC